MSPLPARCPFCRGRADCIDWNEVDVGVGVMQFEHQFECPAHGVFAYDRDGVPIWRDGDPMFLVATNQMSASGCCMSSISTADGGVIFCARKHRHSGAHENAGQRWSGRDSFELLDRAFEEVLACLS